MKIRTKFALGLGILFLLGFGLSGVFVGKRLYEDMDRTGQNYVRENARLFEALVRLEMLSLGNTLVEATSREETWYFMDRELPGPSPFPDLTGPRSGIDLVLFFREDASLYHVEELSGSHFLPADASERIPGLLARSPLPFAKGQKFRAGLVVLAGKPAIMALSPVFRTDGTGSAKGALAFVRLLDAGVMSQISGIGGLPYSLASVDPDLWQGAGDLTWSAEAESPPIRIERGENGVQGIAFISNSAGRPSLALSFPIPGSILAGFRSDVLWWVWGLGGGYFLALTIALFLVNKLFFTPVKGLTDQLECLATLSSSRRRIPVRGTDEISHVVGHINDLLLRLEETRQREHQAGMRFENLVNNLPGVVYRSATDEGWTKDYLGRTFNILTGYDPEDFLGSRGEPKKSLADLIDREDLPRVRNMIANSREQGTPFELRYRIRRKDKRVRWVLDRGKIIFDEFSSRHWIDGVLLDITEQVEAEKCLFDSEARYREIFESSPISLGSEDFSQVKEGLERIRATGVYDIEAYLLEHPEAVSVLASSFRVIDVNQKTLDLFGARTKTELLEISMPLGAEGALDLIGRELVSIFNGDLSFQGEGIKYHLSGRPFNAHVSWKVSPKVNGYERVLRSLEDITPRKTLENQLRYTSHHDPLTGLHNRAYLQQQMAVLDLAQMGPLAVIALDVDGLKLVNDCFGHSAGDELLHKAASVLLRSFRESDHVSRIGGDEFCVILPQCDFQGLQMALQRLGEEIHGEENREITTVPFGLSFGWAFRTKATPSLSVLLQQADRSMYEQKARQREKLLQRFRTAIEDKLDEHGHRSYAQVRCIKKLLEIFCDQVSLPENTAGELALLGRYHLLAEGIPDDALSHSPESTDGEGCRERGKRLVRLWPELAPLAPIFDSLSEHWDGSGSPGKLSGKAIPLATRVFAPLKALAVMALEHQNDGCDLSPLFREIESHSGTRYDPRVVEQLQFLESRLSVPLQSVIVFNRRYP